jgi:FkbM family methyltransferase
MNLKRHFKRWLYGRCPGFKGVLPYFGERVHFPPGSLIFELACAEGIFEQDNLKLLQAALRPNAWYFDIGANIGLMSAPLLATEPTLQAVSVEASPRTARYLAQTIAASPRRDRWRMVAKAIGAAEGEIEFHASAETHGVFDGIKDTGRGHDARKVKVPLTTLDHLWTEAGRPDVCLVKVDVEGGEADVLRGGFACLRATRPYVLLEWNAQNLAAYGCPPDTLLELASTLNYDVLSAPALAPVMTSASLKLHMGVSETFLLTPHA